MKKCKFILVMICFVLISNVFTGIAQAYDDRVIKVGYIDYNGFIEKDNHGIFEGYGVDYLNEISSYTGWKYQYTYDTWSNCLEKLKNGEIDLICTSQYTKERDNNYDFSKYPIGYEVGVLYASKNNKDIFYDDRQAFNGMKVGMLTGSFQNKTFEEYASENNLYYESIMYNSDKEMTDALNKGEVDTIVAGSLSCHENLKVVAKFSVDPFYFITSDGNSEFMKEVDLAIKKIKSNDPYFDSNLYKKYYSNSVVETLPLFTREEDNYIQNKKVLKVGYKDDWIPYTYKDEESGECKGILISLLNDISKSSGLKLEYIPFDYKKDMQKYLSEGKIDIIAGTIENSETSLDDKILFTDSYFKMAMNTISKSANYKEKKNPTLAVLYTLESEKKVLHNYLGTSSVKYYRNLKTCIKAVRTGEADFTVVDKYNTYKLMKDISESKNDIILSSTNSDNIPVSIAISKSSNPHLLSVLNKSISVISEKDINKSIESMAPVKPKFNWQDLIEEHMDSIVIAVLLSTVLVFRFFFIIKRKIMKARSYDELTHCHNLNYFKEQVPKILKKYGTSGYYIIRFDICKFKNINHYYGTSVGDEVLKKLAYECKSRIKEGELFCRASDDNFIALVKLKKEINYEKLFIRVSKNILSQMDLNLPLIFKVGVYKVKNIHETTSEMIDKATMAHRSVKGNSKESFAVYDEKIEKKLLLESKIEIEMESALKNNEFKVFLQPKVDLNSLKILGAEALIRWIKKDGTMIYPDQFIPIFESDGFIEKIDLFVLEEVCKYLHYRKEQGETLFGIAVNQSRHLLTNPQYVNFIFEILDKYDIDSSLIEIEITETLYMENKDTLLKIIDKLHQRGIKLSIDDFGSGYSSLNLITEIPADILKIDRAFLVDSEECEVKNKVIKQVVQLSHELDMEVVCEGVETTKQEEFLCQIGCDMAQGYLYSRPIPISDFEDLISQKNN